MAFRSIFQTGSDDERRPRKRQPYLFQIHSAGGLSPTYGKKKRTRKDKDISTEEVQETRAMTEYFHSDDPSVPAIGDVVYNEVASNVSSQGSQHLSDLQDSDHPDFDTCNACGSSRAWETLMECAYCLEYIHLACFNARFHLDLKAVPDENISCFGQQCKQRYLRMVMSGEIADRLGILTAVKDTSPGDDDSDSVLGINASDDEDESLGMSFNGGDRCKAPNLVTSAARISRIAENEPLAFASIKEWTRTQHGLSFELFKDIAGGLDRLLESEQRALDLSDAQRDAISNIFRKSAPPQNIRRKIGYSNDAAILSKIFTKNFTRQDVEASFHFSYRKPVDAAMDIYVSSVVNMGGPSHDVNHRCSTGRMPDLKEKMNTFFALKGGVPDSPGFINLTIPICLYTDESRSASGNVEFCPCWMTHAMIDPDMRFLLGEKVHALLCLMPDSLSISYRFINGRVGTSDAAELSLTKGQKRQAVVEFRQKALQELLKDIKSSEDEGVLYQYAGRVFRIQIIVAYYVTDMKERRALLCLRSGAVYDCSQCYDFPGKNVKKRDRRGPRSSVKDARIRRDFTRGRAKRNISNAGTAEGEFKAEFGKLGIGLVDKCVFTSTAESSVFTLHGPYELFPFDALHNKDGVINYYTKFLESLLGEQSFIQQTQAFGNVHLMTKKFSMHVMETGIESFHSVPLAIMFGTFHNDIDQSVRAELFRGSCDLIEVLTLLTDPCPAYVEQRLLSAINRLKAHIVCLLKEIVDLGRGQSKMTTKMHELFTHAVHQIAQFGLPSAFSSKLYETFHELIKKSYQDSSKRRKDGSAAREIVQCFYHRAVVEHTERLLSKSNPPIPAWTRYQEVPMFAISNADKRLSIEAMFQRNVRKTTETIFQLHQSPKMQSVNLPSEQPYGSTLRMWVGCELRQSPITREKRCVVPGTSLGMFFHGGSFNVLSYKSTDSADLSDYDGSVNIQECGDAECQSRHHRSSFQLFCSAARDRDTAYAIPLLFVSNFVIAWPLKALNQEQSSVPIHSAMREFKCETKTTVFISFDSIRGPVMGRSVASQHSQRRLFVYPGRNVFGYTSG